MIGENMKRVSKAADTIGAEIFTGEGMAANQAWIRAAKADGAVIYDIGPDFQRRALRVAMGERPESKSYQMELHEMSGYSGHVPLC